MLILYPDLIIGQHPQFPAVDSIVWIVLLYIEYCFCPMYLHLLLRAFLFRHSVVYSLQSVPEAQSEAVCYRTEKGNKRKGHGCWWRPDGRKRIDLHLSGNVQSHAGTAERICSLSPSDIRVPTIFSFLFSNNYVLCSVSSKKVWISELTKNTILCRPISSTLYVTIYFVHSFSFASAWLHKPHTYGNIRYLAHQVGSLQNLRVLSSLTALLQVSNGGFHEVTFSKPSSDRGWRGAVSVIERIIVISFLCPTAEL